VLTSYLLWSRVVVTSSEPVKSQGLPPAGLPLMAVSDRDDP
jgi:hypothetical protein